VNPPAGVLAPTPVSVVPADAPAPVAMERRSARVALLGASGYTGLEFARLSEHHTGLELVALASRRHAGQAAAAILPGLDPRATRLPPVCDAGALEALLQDGAFDTLVVALPHGAWAELAAERPALAEQPACIVDLSSDHRDGRNGYAYGLPEAFRDSIAGATRVANPGCYPTAAALALLPAADLIDGPVMVSALSGVSGAGRSAQLRTSYVELEGSAGLYQAGTSHAHVAEMERTLARVAGADVTVGFAPVLAPMSRGILLTATAPLAAALSPDAVRARYAARYEGERFVRLLEPGDWPETRTVRGSNRCDLAVTTMHGGRTLLATAAIDNLVKGAAGQAIQNLNLMLGWPEDWGLPFHGTPW
jgi:N-acetyl-gamma-glutamyl-phosphate reductase